MSGLGVLGLWRWHAEPGNRGHRPGDGEEGRLRTARDRLLRPEGRREAHAGPERAWPREPGENQKREGRWMPREERAPVVSAAVGSGRGGREELDLGNLW